MHNAYSRLLDQHSVVDLLSPSIGPSCIMLLVWLRGRQRISYSGQVVSRYVEVRLQPAGVEGDSAGRFTMSIPVTYSAQCLRECHWSPFQGRCDGGYRIYPRPQFDVKDRQGNHITCLQT